MNEITKNKLEAAIDACADKAAKAETSPIEAMQLTQAAVNASNVTGFWEATTGLENSASS